MKSLKNKRKSKETPTWEEESGLLKFLSEVPREVRKFNERFEFGINQTVKLPATIDEEPAPSLNMGFVLTRHNPLMPEFTYCLYTLLENGVMQAYIGIYADDNITTLKQLKPLRDFQKGSIVLYDWLSQLVRASLEKIMK